MTDIRTAAAAAHKAGICVVPAREDGSKAPDIRSWPDARPDDAQMREWFGTKESPTERTGLYFICGALSGGLECIDFDDPDAVIAFKGAAKGLGLWDLVKRIELGYSERTPGGIHWLYRTAAPLGNTKLASKPCPGAPECAKHEAGKPHGLIETRGERGGIVAAPSHGTVHESGEPYVLLAGGPATIPIITDEERDALWAVARSLDQMPRERIDARPTARGGGAANGTRPGDLWAATTSWRDILEPHGWTLVVRRGALEYWRRPGKQFGMSASTGIRGNDPDADYLYVFSTSTDFDAERAYNKFAAYALLNCQGDYSAAARELAAQGYRDNGTTYSETLTASGSSVSRPPVAVSAVKQAGGGAIGETPVRCSTAPYRFDAIFDESHFIGRYVAYASRKNDAPHEYHEALAAVILGAVTPGVRAHLSAWPTGLATNLYLVLVGDSTRFRKSTATGEAKLLLAGVDPGAVFPDHFSVEAMMEQIAVRSGKPAIWFPDELGHVLDEAERKPLLHDALTTLYDSPATYDYARHSKRIKGGSVVDDHDRIQDPHWNVVGATTPAIFDSLSTRTVQSGLLPRFAYVYPTAAPPRMPLQLTSPTMSDEQSMLRQYVRDLATWAAVAGKVAVEFAPGVLEEIDRFQAGIEESGQTMLARLAPMAVKLAMISALGEGVPRVPRVVVELRDAERAVRLAGRWRAHAVRFASEIGGYSREERKFQQRVDKALAFTRERQEVTRQEVMRHMRLSSRDLDEVQMTLVDGGYISAEVMPSSGGRKPTVWKATEH